MRINNAFFMGCHLSAAGGLGAMARQAVSMGANVCQFFLRSPQGGAARAFDAADAADMVTVAQENNFGPLLVHAPYTLNPCSAKPNTRAFARDIFIDDLRRMAHFPGNLYNFHPGSHVGQGVEVGIGQISELLDIVFDTDKSTIVLLETMAGKGSEVGSRFEELRAIIDRVSDTSRLGVCFDTCHVSDAGYPVADDLDGVLREFDRVVGLDRLRAVHLNDSKNPCGAHKDRHALIGEGTLGVEALARVVNHPLIRDRPFYLETPGDIPKWTEEIALMRKLRD